MTERPARGVARDQKHFAIGDSLLAWRGGDLVIDIREYGAPIPLPVKGRVRISPSFITRAPIALDRDGRHRWWPLAPHGRVEVTMEQPGISWSGHAYLDTNAGSVPLEEDFHRWDWSRTSFRDGTAILYKALTRDTGEQPLALWIGADGATEQFTPGDDRVLPATLWRVERRTQSDDGFAPHVVRTLEDSPFYARSMIETSVRGRRGIAIHESLSLDRFRLPIVKAMLPFRMPRAFWQKAQAGRSG
jgi:carotenoid 1,2-hydratase